MTSILVHLPQATAFLGFKTEAINDHVESMYGFKPCLKMSLATSQRKDLPLPLLQIHKRFTNMLDLNSAQHAGGRSGLISSGGPTGPEGSIYVIPTMAVMALGVWIAWSQREPRKEPAAILATRS